jgi:DNA-binding response OmpR family regulator
MDHAHIYSQKVFEEADADPSISPDRYKDLTDLLETLGSESGTGWLAPADEVLGEREVPNLLVIDDEPTISEVLKGRLVEWGYPPEYVHEFAMSTEALHFASNNPVGIAFIDIKLDGGVVQDPMYTSGMEVLKAIKRESPSARAILVSGFGTYEMARRGILDLGASFYLSKPFRLADVVRIVSWGVERTDVAARASTRFDPGSNEHILIVDDDPVLSESVSLGLRTFGYQTTEVARGEAAFDAVRGTRFDAILLDLMMPGVSGLDVMRWLQRERRNVDVFVLSALSDDLTARQVMDLGAKGYFLKPCDISLITRTLEFHFAKRVGG